MDWSILSTAVKDVAPVLGTTLLGPLGGIVGNLIGSAIGIKSGTPKDIADAISSGSFTDILKDLEASHAGLMTYLRPISKITVSVEFSQ